MARPRTGKERVLTIRCRNEVFLALKELQLELMKKKRSVSLEDVLIELLRYHPRGLELLSKYGIKMEDSLW